jgi:hypothetical protein
MKNRTLVIIGVITAVLAAFVMYRKNVRAQQDQPSNVAQDQMPSAVASQYYRVPPNIGAQVDNTGGTNYPTGKSSDIRVSTSTGQAQPMPVNGQPVTQ